MRSQTHTSASDERSNIGKRYYSQDKIGTPFCVIVDFETLENDTVTVRERDMMEQVRLPVPELLPYYQDRIANDPYL
jgi:glycyl-tRNA synthetase